MMFIPLTVFLLVIVVVMGGPTAFVDTVSYWVVDLLTFVGRSLKDLF